MNIKTTRFGTIPIEEEKLIHMPFGMLGFADQRRFIILKHQENSPFYWYQSVDDPTLAFVIMTPFLIMPDYRVDMEDALKEMGWNGDNNRSHLELYVVVNIPKGAPHEMTANLIGPLLINNSTRQAIQMVLSNSPYSHKHPLIKGPRA